MINRTRVRRGLWVQCVIILMKYRFGTIKQLSSTGKELLTFSLLNKAIYFTVEGSMTGCKHCVPVKCRHSFTGEQLINHNKWYSITSSVLSQQYKPQCISAASSIIKKTITKQALENCLYSLRSSFYFIFVTCLVFLNDILTNLVTCDNLKWLEDFFSIKLSWAKQFFCSSFIVGGQSPPIYFMTVRQEVVLKWFPLMCAACWHVLI